jgi:hypothetical protein
LLTSTAFEAIHYDYLDSQKAYKIRMTGEEILLGKKTNFVSIELVSKLTKTGSELELLQLRKEQELQTLHTLNQTSDRNRQVHLARFNGNQLKLVRTSRGHVDFVSFPYGYNAQNVITGGPDWLNDSGLEIYQKQRSE